MALKYEAPPEGLRYELEELAKIAKECEDNILSSNILSEEFPTESLIAILKSLQELKEGTAEGCRHSLEYSRQRLPAIRRRYFRIDRDTDGEMCEHLPIRGMFLDRSIVEVISAVTTTLDEYRQLATASFDDSINFDDEEFVSDKNLNKEPISRASNLEETLGEKRAKLNRIITPFSQKGDNLSRAIQDAKNTARLGRSELSQPRIVVRWLRNIANALNQYPNILRTLGNGILVSVDIAQPFREVWNNFWSDFDNFVFTKISEVGNSFIEVSENLEKRRQKNREKIGAGNQNEKKERDSIQRFIFEFVQNRDKKNEKIEIGYLASAIQFQFGKSGKNIAKELGHKNLTELILSIDELTILTGYGKMYVYLKNRAHKLQTEMSKNRKKLENLSRLYIITNVNEIIGSIPSIKQIENSLKKEFDEKIFGYRENIPGNKHIIRKIRDEFT